MSQWKRSGPLPKEIKVNFIVKAEDYPELAQWLYDLPYKGISVAVRDLLNSVVTGESVRIDLPVREPVPSTMPQSQSYPAPDVVPPLAQPVMQAAPATVQATQVIPVAPAVPAVPIETMDAESAQALAEMSSRF